MRQTNDAYAGIKWPRASAHRHDPEWTGRGFRIGDELYPVLANDIGDSGWSEELGALINMEVAPDRPLGIASRRHVVDALRRHGAGEAGKVIMEIGCAHGFTLEDMRTAFPGASILGSDYALTPLKALASRLPDLPLVQLDILRSKFPDAFCDAVVLLNVLEHIERDDKALCEIRRMLKPGGLLVIEVPSGPGLYDDFDRAVGHFRRYTMGELVGKLEQAGFDVDRRSHLGFFTFPAFWFLVNYRKLRKAKAAPDANDVLKSRIKVGRKSAAQQLIFEAETALRPLLPMPFGVRCIATAVARP